MYDRLGSCSRSNVEDEVGDGFFRTPVKAAV